MSKEKGKRQKYDKREEMFGKTVQIKFDRPKKKKIGKGFEVKTKGRENKEKTVKIQFI